MRPRIAVLYPATDPLAPENWSGTPKGLANGLSRIGFEVVPIPCRVPDWARIPVGLLARVKGARGIVAHHEPVYAAARSIAMASGLRRIGPVEGIVAMGTDLFDLPRAIRGVSARVATYDDGTFPLFLRYPDSELSRSAFPTAVTEAWSRRQAAACRTASLACVSTAWARDSVVNDFGVMPEKVAVVGMGHRLRDVPHGRDFSTPRYLFVGVDWTRKNGRAVLDAFERVKALHPTATLDLVGRHPDVHRAGVTGHGYLRRDNPDAQALLDRLFASSTAFVLPSLFDPSPVAYLEAASAGLPVIATTYGGAGELLGPAAISVDPHDSEAIVSAMLAVANPTRAQAMGMAARRVAEDSSWDRVAARITTPLLLGSLRTDARLA